MLQLKNISIESKLNKTITLGFIIFIEGTCSFWTFPLILNYKYYDKCKEQGYEITIIFVGTNDPEINVNRVLKRVAQGGHDVPKDIIIERYYKSMNNLFTLACTSDVLYLFDNSIDSNPRLCVYRDKSRELKIINKQIGHKNIS